MGYTSGVQLTMSKPMMPRWNTTLEKIDSATSGSKEMRSAIGWAAVVYWKKIENWPYCTRP